MESPPPQKKDKSNKSESKVQVVVLAGTHPTLNAVFKR